MDDKKDINTSIHEFYNKIKLFYPIKKMFLYGSFARGTQRKDSDIDVGVVIDTTDHSHRIQITSRLFHYAREVNNAIEPKCIFFDEYMHHDKASILGEIIRTGKDISFN